MNLSGVVAESGALILENLASVFSAFFNRSIMGLEFKVIKGTKVYEISSLGLVRYITLKNSNFVIFGCSDPYTLKIINEVEETRLVELELLLMQALKMSIATKMSSTTEHGQGSRLFEATADQIGFLKKCDATHVLQFIFKDEEAKLIFEIPLDTTKYKSSEILTATGFYERAKILIVDDSKLNRLIVKNYLSAAGFLNIDEAEDGKIALKKLKQSATGYELIIADWHMPEVNGIDVLREFRLNIEPKSLTPFILATSEQKKDEILMALKLKVSGYLIKPYSAEKLFSAMKLSAATLARSSS